MVHFTKTLAIAVLIFGLTVMGGNTAGLFMDAMSLGFSIAQVDEQLKELNPKFNEMKLNIENLELKIELSDNKSEPELEAQLKDNRIVLNEISEKLLPARTQKLELLNKKKAMCDKSIEKEQQKALKPKTGLCGKTKPNLAKIAEKKKKTDALMAPLLEEIETAEKELTTLVKFMNTQESTALVVKAGLDEKKNTRPVFDENWRKEMDQNSADINNAMKNLEDAMKQMEDEKMKKMENKKGKYSEYENKI